MLPVYERTHDANLAWHMGIFASLVSGIVQSASAFCIDWLRRTTPLAALLCPLAGLAMAFLCLGFIFGIFQIPAVALLPAVIFSRCTLRECVSPGAFLRDSWRWSSAASSS